MKNLFPRPARSLVVSLLFYSFSCDSQPWNNRTGLDSMLRRLSVSKEDSAKSLLQEFISYCYLDLNHDSAVFYAQEEMATAQRIGWRRGIANGYADIGNCHMAQGNYVVALLNYYKGLAIYEELNFKYGISALSNNIAGIYESHRRYDDALKFYLKALYIKKNEMDSTFTYAGMSGDMYMELSAAGRIYNLKGDSEKAISYYEAAMKNARALGSRKGIVTALTGMADVHKSRQKYNLAAAEFHEALSIVIKSGMKGDLSDIYSGLAVLHYEIAENLGAVEPDKYISPGRAVNLQLAVDYINKAIAVSRELGFTAQLHEQLHALSEYYSLQGNYKEGFAAYKEYVKLKDTLFSDESRQKLSTLENQRALELKDKDIRIAELEVEKKNNERVFYVAGIILLLGILAVLFRSFRLQKKNNTLLTQEKKRSDDLLLNILPAEVAEELKDKGSSAARLYDEVTVLFTDFVDFTATSEKLTPGELIKELNECFTAFDGIVERNGLEKIKTIGDAYLAVCGLPENDPEHARKTVQAGIEFSNFVNERKRNDGAFQVRIGINSGPVVAGIVGVKKFAYDIWGDTVNTAARMEQNSEAGKVNISQTTYELVKNDFNCNYRGKIAAKNKGDVEMYFVEQLIK